jgi:hypothetical protein
MEQDKEVERAATPHESIGEQRDPPTLRERGIRQQL